MKWAVAGFLLAVVWIATLNVAVRKGFAAGVKQGRRSILSMAGGMGEEYR